MNMTLNPNEGSSLCSYNECLHVKQQICTLVFAVPQFLVQLNVLNEPDRTRQCRCPVWEVSVSVTQHTSIVFAYDTTKCRTKHGARCVTWSLWRQRNLRITQVCENLFIPVVQLGYILLCVEAREPDVLGFRERSMKSVSVICSYRFHFWT